MLDLKGVAVSILLVFSTAQLETNAKNSGLEMTDKVWFKVKENAQLPSPHQLSPKNSTYHFA
jgi:hypothetical protein